MPQFKINVELTVDAPSHADALDMVTSDFGRMFEVGNDDEHLYGWRFTYAPTITREQES